MEVRRGEEENGREGKRERKSGAGTGEGKQCACVGREERKKIEEKKKEEKMVLWKAVHRGEERKEKRRKEKRNGAFGQKNGAALFMFYYYYFTKDKIKDEISFKANQWQTRDKRIPLLFSKPSILINRYKTPLY
jgi:hypothetical protein